MQTAVQDYIKTQVPTTTHANLHLTIDMKLNVWTRFQFTAFIESTIPDWFSYSLHSWHVGKLTGIWSITSIFILMGLSSAGRKMLSIVHVQSNNLYAFSLPQVTVLLPTPNPFSPLALDSMLDCEVGESVPSPQSGERLLFILLWTVWCVVCACTSCIAIYSNYRAREHSTRWLL